MTALELFTRQAPFPGISSMTGVITRIVKGPPDRPAAQSTCDRLTDAWWSICTRCWKQDPAKRPSLSDILADIERAISTIEPHSSGCRSPSPTVGLIDEARDMTSINHSIHSRDVEPRVHNQWDISGHINQKSTPLERIDIPMPPTDLSRHYTSHVVPLIPTDDYSPIRSQSDWNTALDIDRSKPCSTQLCPANSIQLAPESTVAQPFSPGVAGTTESRSIVSHLCTYGGLYFLLAAIVIARLGLL